MVPINTKTVTGQTAIDQIHCITCTRICISINMASNPHVKYSPVTSIHLLVAAAFFQLAKHCFTQCSSFLYHLPFTQNSFQTLSLLLTCATCSWAPRTWTKHIDLILICLLPYYKTFQQLTTKKDICTLSPILSPSLSRSISVTAIIPPSHYLAHS